MMTGLHHLPSGVLLLSTKSMVMAQRVVTSLGPVTRMSCSSKRGLNTVFNISMLNK
jgi:hypothetical protein